MNQPLNDVCHTCEAAYVCTVGTWSSLCDICLHTYCTLAREAAYMIFVFQTCMHFGTWSSLCDICLPYLSALWYVKQPMWNLSAMPVCTVGTCSSLCEIYLPCLCALLAREADHVKFICHACLALLASEAAFVIFVCHTWLQCWHVKQPMW